VGHDDGGEAGGGAVGIREHHQAGTVRVQVIVAPNMRLYEILLLLLLLLSNHAVLAHIWIPLLCPVES
jgi:hypothetical protein